MSKHKIEFDCECDNCGGTGLYVGMAERGGVAVVCHTCNGTGKVHRVVTYTDFDGRKTRKGIVHVLRCNPGIMVGTDGPRNKYQLSDFGGMSYADWSADKPFPPKSEMRRFVCPAWWYQTADYDRKPDWKDGIVQCRGIGSFSGCRHFHEKERCWARWDAENSTKKGGTR